MNNLKTPILYTLIVLAGLYIYSLLGPAIPISVSSVVTNKQNLFTVSGEGKISAVPDEALVRLGMQATTSTVAQGQQQVNETVNKLLDSLKNMGIKKEDIKTENYSIYPTYGQQQNRITGYTVNTNIVITIKDLTKTNEIIDTATKAGLNSVGGVEFKLSDKMKSDVTTEARKNAVAEAKKKAESLANISGLRLGKIINVQEDSNGIGSPIIMRAESAMKDAANPSTATEIQPGSTDVTLMVTLTYETK